MKNVRKNITYKEATCGDGCGLIASVSFLNRLQKLRDRCGFPLPFTSIVRCELYNIKIGGSGNSAHLLSANPDRYGAVDIGIKKWQMSKRYIIDWYASRLFFNQKEIADYHLHFGVVPRKHPHYKKLYWGISK